jgi:lysophospholipase L1-like esterase
MLPHRIAAIGASTFFGRVDPEGGGFIGRLKIWHEKSHRKNCLFNLGISSETSRDFLKRLTSECAPRRPDLIILAACSNDARRVGSRSARNEVPLEEFKRNLTTLILEARELADVFVVLGHPIDEKRTTPISYKENYYLLSDLEEYMESAIAVCNKLKIPYLDVFHRWQTHGDYLFLLYEDGLHPGPAGHEDIFHALKAGLEGVYA